MKIIALLLALVLANFAIAGDHEGGTHTPNFCSKTNVNSCAHLRFENYPTSEAASEFIVHILSSTGNPVENLKVKLWMPSMGHGSRPVTIQAMDELNHFFVQNAWFVMPGQWQVIVNYTDAGADQQVIIPLDI